MNPLNPWVALTEMLLLLGMAFALGWGIAYAQYRQRIHIQKRAIRDLQDELKPFSQPSQD